MAKLRDKTKPPAEMSKLEKLDSKQILALTLLSQGNRPGEVARQVGCNRGTIWRWLKEPAFSEALADLQADLTGNARVQIRNLVRDAVDELADLLTCEDPKVRMQAVNCILDRAGIDGSPDPREKDAIWELAFSATTWEAENNG